MRADEYFERKRARKRAVRSARRWRKGEWQIDEWPAFAAGDNCVMMSGTTADIDTVEKRHEIATTVLAAVERMVRGQL